MNFDQIRKKAESENMLLLDTNCIKIYIASLPDNESARETAGIFRLGVKKYGLNAVVTVAGSFGYYDIEPIIIIEKPGQPEVFYKNADAKTAQILLDEYIIHDNPRPDLAFCTERTDKVENIPSMETLSLFNVQKRIALRNCGYIDPESISHYILRGGYTGLAKALKMDQAAVIEEIKKSGLRGRGGAGYPAGEKLKACLDAEEKEKYIICNAVDSDPKTNTARLLLTSDPHSFLEGMLISAYAAGSSGCIVYTDAEYNPAIQNLDKAISQMRDFGLLGSNIMDSDFSCEIDIKKAQRSMVSGEETALLRSLEGKQTMPYMRPPYPETKGLNCRPTIVSNIETLSNLSAVFQYGPEILSSLGTEKSKGTKTIAFHGKGSRNFTIEVPFGTSLRTIIDIMEGKTNGKIKAVQFGGPTGAYLNGAALDLAIDHDKVRESGYIIGSGSIEIFYNDMCAVEMAKEISSYLHNQSCGKCVFCREGTFQISEILEDISKGLGRPNDISLINEIGEQMKSGCICDFGRTAANPALSAIRLFYNEFDTHIKDKKCQVQGNNRSV